MVNKVSFGGFSGAITTPLGSARSMRPIRVGAGKFVEVQRIFARIFPKLPENFFCVQKMMPHFKDLPGFSGIFPGFSRIFPRFSTNQNFWGSVCTTTSFTTDEAHCDDHDIKGITQNHYNVPIGFCATGPLVKSKISALFQCQNQRNTARRQSQNIKFAPIFKSCVSSKKFVFFYMKTNCFCQ